MERMNKTIAQEKIKDFFENIETKDKSEIQKIKKLAMHYKIRLKDNRKKFCKSCFSTKFTTRRITKDKKILECSNCKKLIRLKI